MREACLLFFSRVITNTYDVTAHAGSADSVLHSRTIWNCHLAEKRQPIVQYDVPVEERAF